MVYRAAVAVGQRASFISRRAAAAQETPVEALLIDLLAAAIATAAAAATRIVLEQFVGGIAPFVLTFPAVIAATLVRGGRAGTITTVSCQLLTIRYVFPHWLSRHGGLSTDLINVLISTLTLAATVWATAAYRSSAAALRQQCERQVKTLSLLISEMDHRTRNNFQIAANLLAYQASAAMDGALARELDQAATRLASIASLYDDLGGNESADDRRDLGKYVARVVGLLREGATPSRILLGFKGADVVVSAQSAVIVGLIVNEWVTNALKHAFGEHTGRIDVRMRMRGDEVEVSVIDDGAAAEATRTSGDGLDLVRAMADVIGANVTITRNNGTKCSLRFSPNRD